MSKIVNTMHIYAQDMWHNDAFIVGDTESLKALRDAIDRALVNEQNEASTSTFATDGEGYRVIVLNRDLDQHYEVALPYTDEIAQERREDAVWPYKLCKNYKKLATSDV